ncbi:ribosomal protein S18-alanine N-acetyltransferase [Chloroflexota bacterium]
MRFNIRNMHMRDTPQVVEIEREAFPSMEPATNFRRELKNGIAHYIVAFEDSAGQKVIGLAGLWLLTVEAHIVNIAVRKPYRQRGIGELLLIGLIEKTLAKEASAITLEVRASDDIAKSLYLKYGFNIEGLRRGYYLDNREDAIIMTLNGIATPEFKTRLQRLKESHSSKWD